MVRSERGQVLVMFAVLVPIFVALMVFVLKVGKAYFDHAGAQQTAESVMRTVEAILGDDAEEVSSVSLGAVSYSPTEEQTELKKLEAAINFFKDETGAAIDQQFMIDGNDLYYRIDAGSHSAIFKIESDPVKKLTKQLLNATVEDRTAIINALVNPSTDKEKTANVETISGFLLNSVDPTIASDGDVEKIKNTVLTAIVDSTGFANQEKGVMFDAFLSRNLTPVQLQSADANNLKVLAISSTPNITAEMAADILYAVLSIMPSVEQLQSPVSQGTSRIITYKDNATSPMYHRLYITNVSKNGKPKSNNVQVTHSNESLAT